jgi:uncharacterized membrane protein YdjX (TVP38/TMEM64 family)
MLLLAKEARDIKHVIENSKKLGLNNQTIAIIIIASSTIFVGLVLTILVNFFNLQTYIANILAWIDSAGVWGPLVFILMDILIVIFLIPGVLITMGAGFVFGVIQGSIYIVLGTTIGAAISFTTSRYFFSERISRYFTSHKKAQFLNQFLAADGWKIIFFLRLIPFFPFKLSNYLFGLTEFKMRDFVMGTFLGIWPITVFNVYIGSLAASLSKLGKISESNQTQLYFYIFSLICAIVAIIYIVRRASLALKQYSLTQTNTQ